MEKKDVKLMSNAEIKLYKMEIENNFESIKIKIQNLCDELLLLENEYNHVENEMKIRKTIY